MLHVWMYHLRELHHFAHVGCRALLVSTVCVIAIGGLLVKAHPMYVGWMQQQQQQQQREASVEWIDPPQHCIAYAGDDVVLCERD